MDPRNRPTTHGGVDLNEIEPNWIKNCTSAKKMRSAVKLLTEDGYYPDLLKMAEDKLCELDPVYKRRKELPNATEEDRAEAAKSIEEFLSEIEKPKEKTAEELKVEQAKEERMRGNECVAAQDYKIAINYYERSIKLDPTEAATYSNRALAYLKLKDYKNAFSDAEAAISLMPGYLKAYHRRAEAALGLGEYERGYIDVRAILIIEPDNVQVKETMKKILKKAQSSKVELDPEKIKIEAEKTVKVIQEGVKKQKVISKAIKSKTVKAEKVVKPEAPKKEGGFVRVAITEDASESSDSDDEEDTKEKEIWTKEEVKVAVEKEASEMDVEKLLGNYTKLKDEGNTLNRSGQYNEAIAKYLEAIKELKNTQGLSENALVKYEAIANSNIAVCYKQMQDSNNVIAYTTKVIDSKIPESQIIIKALVLRAFAYESIDKLPEAKDDWTSVKQLQWNNTDATLGLARVNEAFKRDKGQQIGETLRSIKPQLEEYKKDGNTQYKAGKHIEAIEHFTKGIDWFKEKCKEENFTYVPKDLTQIVTQLYTNRCLSYHMLNKHNEAVEDANYVISKIDSKNTKAFYRRGVALSKLGDNEKALTDLQQAVNLDPGNDLVKAEMKKVLDLVIEERKKKLKTEVKKEQSKQMIEEISTTGKAAVSQSKEITKKKRITSEQIKKAAELAAQSLGKDYLEKPKTAYAFENIWRSHKDEHELLYQFLCKNVDPDYLITLFGNSAISTEIYFSLLKILNINFKE